jgi:hypothetical protein
MALTAGAISLVSKTSSTANLSSTAASGGTGPYTYQWYRSTVAGFTPGGGNILSGKTALTLADTGLQAGTTYYYKLVSTDTGDSNVTVTGSSAAIQTPQVGPAPNQFAQSVIVGMVDLPYSYNTKSVQIDISEAGVLLPGQAVKIVDSAGGIPKVIACAADTDEVFGFLNYNIKNASFLAGKPAEISQDGNVMFLQATAAIARGAKVVSKALTTVGGVGPISGSGGENIVGYALDKASAAGDIIRVQLMCPSFLADGV